MNSPRRKIIILLFLLLFFGVLFLQGDHVKSFFYSISDNSFLTLSKAGNNVADFFEVIFNSKTLQLENKEIVFENQEIKSELSLLKEVQKENDVLRKALSLELEKEFKLLLSRAVFKNPSEDFLVINKGGNDGILSGMAVIMANKTLVGKVSNVYSDFSEVSLISHKDSNFPIKIQDRDIVARARGNGNSSVLIDFIPRDREIEYGDRIITIDLESVYPKNIFVGEINSIKETDLAPHVESIIKPGYVLEDIDHIFVILEH